jgi:hypothetical protein
MDLTLLLSTLLWNHNLARSFAYSPGQTPREEVNILLASSNPNPVLLPTLTAKLQQISLKTRYSTQ